MTAFARAQSRRDQSEAPSYRETEAGWREHEECNGEGCAICNWQGGALHDDHGNTLQAISRREFERNQGARID